jgi:hypothetical protein
MSGSALLRRKASKSKSPSHRSSWANPLPSLRAFTSQTNGASSGPKPRRVGDGVGAPNRIELVQKRGDVKLGGVDGEMPSRRAITLFDAPLGQQGQNLQLAGRQRDNGAAR